MDLEQFWAPYAGAVSLSFDDGIASQLAKAIPAMDQRGIKGTFYLCPRGRTWREDLAPWVQVARDGHEIGNHSLSHRCSGNFSGRPGGLEEWSPADVEADILAAAERLRSIAPKQEDWTFAYPCYQTFVGRGADRQSYVPVVAKHFLAGRAGCEYGQANHPAVIDLACVWGHPTERMAGPEMIGLVEQLASCGRWLILIFHEIDGARLTVGSHEFNMLLDYLHRRHEDIWTAPIAHVARKIADFRTAQPNPPEA